MKIKIPNLRYIRPNGYGRNPLFTVLLVALMALMSESLVPNHIIGQKILWVFVALLGIICYISSQENHKNSKESKIFIVVFSACLPFLFAFLYTCVLSIFGISSGMGVVPQAFTSAMFAVVDMLVVSALFYLYKEHAIDIAYNVVVCSYIIGIILTIFRYGLREIVRYVIGNRVYGDFLERHDIGTAVISLILYYGYLVFCMKSKDKRNRKRIIILFAIMLLCGKRSAYVALVMGTVVLFIFAGKFKNKVKITAIVSAVTLAVSFAYIVMIQSGALENFVSAFGINSTGRVYVWSWFRNQYEVSPAYLGKGFQYIHRYMTLGMGKGRGQYSYVNDFNYLHNSILQIFIETGFWGFFLWMGFLLFSYPRMLKKNFNLDCVYLYTVLVVSMIVNYMVDNTLTYPVFQVVTYTAILNLAEEKSGI